MRRLGPPAALLAALALLVVACESTPQSAPAGGLEAARQIAAIDTALTRASRALRTVGGLALRPGALTPGERAALGQAAATFRKALAEARRLRHPRAGGEQRRGSAVEVLERAEPAVEEAELLTDAGAVRRLEVVGLRLQPEITRLERIRRELRARTR